MKVLLVYPPITVEERFGSKIGNSGGRQIPLGILYLASSARERGHDVRVVDAEADSLSAHDVAEKAAEFEPDVVGISTTTVAFHRALEAAESIRERRPGVAIVCGGPHVSSCAEDVMSRDVFDYAIQGEGEISFVRLLEKLESGADAGDLTGLAFRRNGRTIVNPPGEFIANLDEIPFPAFDLLPDLSKYNPPVTNYKAIPVVSVISARGCPCSCTFCARNMGEVLRLRSAENVADEIQLLHRDYGAREVAFADDTFTYRPSRIRELFLCLEKRGIRLPWSCKSRIDTVDYELLKFMKENGCWNISFGIESGSRHILKTIGKNIDIGRAREVVTWCARLGIQARGNFIIGHPGETAETLEETIKTALSMKLYGLVVTMNTPLPGTRQFDEYEKHGTLDSSDWSKFSLNHPVFVPTGLSAEIIKKKQREFYTRFYFRPGIMWRYFLNLFSSGGTRRLMALLRSLPYVLAGR